MSFPLSKAQFLLLALLLGLMPIPGEAQEGAAAASPTKRLSDPVAAKADAPVGNVLKPSMTLTSSDARDQDDCCFWIHPTDAARSVVITSDKAANAVFVYDLNAKLLQKVAVPKPGNIDTRQDVAVGGSTQDLIVVNQRSEGFALVVFRMNAESRTLERIDTGCTTAPNYGGCLYRSHSTGELYFFCTSEEGLISQYELNSDSDGRIHSNKVRELTTGKCEGAVAHDQTGHLFVSDETKGIWRFDAEPEGASEGKLIAAVGEHGLMGDVEGLCLCKLHIDRTCLIVSDQGSNRFAAYDCNSGQFVGAFQIEGVGATDGIELCSASLGTLFPDGAFACHNGFHPVSLSVTSWASIQQFLSKQIQKPIGN